MRRLFIVRSIDGKRGTWLEGEGGFEEGFGVGKYESFKKMVRSTTKHLGEM